MFCWGILGSFYAFCQQIPLDSAENSWPLSSATARVSHDEFNQGVIHSPYQLINGRMTGLGMSTIGNDPNGEFLLRVRGLSTFQIDTRPLIVIDGFITEDLKTVDPNDIAQFMLLKDAAAASGYGLQGGNGVLLISTKAGTGEQTSVCYTTTFGFEQAMLELRPNTSSAYLQYPYSVDLGDSQDWLDLITQTGISSIHNLALSKSTRSFSVRASINYRLATGTLQGTGLDQLNSRISMQTRALKDRLLIQARLAATTRKSDFGFREAFKYAFSANPTMPVYDPFSSEYGGYSQQQTFDAYNPVAMIEQNTNSGKEMTSMIGLNGDYQFDGVLNGLGIKLSYQLIDTRNLQGRYYSKNSYYVGHERNGLASRMSGNRSHQQMESSVYYSRKLKDLYFQISSGYRYQEYNRSTLYMEGGDFLTDAFGFNNMAASGDFQNGLGIVSSSMDSYKVITWQNSASVLFKDKYFLNATANYSGSTRLGENNKWGLFPSLGGGIQWDDGVLVFNSLTLRASWGKAGNIPQQSNLSRTLLTPATYGNYMYSNGTYIPSYYTTRDGNADLKWEEKSEINIGADFTLLNHRLSGSIDWFNNKVSDLISPVQIESPPNLSNSMVANIGELQNRGVEINLNVSARKTMKFSWDFYFNLSRVTTTVNSLSGNGYSIGTNGEISIGFFPDAGGCSSHGVNLIQEGAALGQIQGPIYTGVGQNGQPMHADLSGDGMYCDCQDDFAVLGNALPKFFFGFGNRLLYKNFEISFLLRGAVGHHKINAYRIYQEAPGSAGWTNLIETSYFNPALAYTHLSSNYVEKASFMKLDNISLTYHVPSRLKLDVRLTVQNLITISKYSGLDPEVAFGNPVLAGQTTYPINQTPLVSGLELRGEYLPARIFSLGVSLKL
jgi:iron complex outermembrane receptor protein